MSLKLNELLGERDHGVDAARSFDVTITGLTADSRKVEAGYLFAALPGQKQDGRAYIADALERGAVAVLAEMGTMLPGSLAPASAASAVLIEAENPRRKLAQLAATFYGRQPDVIAAVTGTNGKTSVVWFLQQLWSATGHVAACLGTLGVKAPGLEEAGSLTTPDSVNLHALLSRLADRGVERLAMEASSHGLDQFRLDGVRVAAAAFTNISRDHLDYHGSMTAYLAAKLRLFGELVSGDGVAVVCADVDGAADVMAVASERHLRCLTYGRTGSDLRLVDLRPHGGGQTLALCINGMERQVYLPLVGSFQALNALAAIGLALATGSSVDELLPSLETLQAVPGRLERVADVRGASVYVDYAHTPDALAVVLKSLREQTPGRLVVVFGCGGDRDPGKRPEMGRIVAQYADIAVVTDDNPRSEPPAAIRREVLVGCPGAREIGDRTDAIAEAISLLRPGDVAVVAGKGHESGQIVGGRILPFNDADVIRDVVLREQT